MANPGQAAARQAIVNWFTTANIPGLAAIHRSVPKIINAQDFNLSAENGSGCIIVVHLTGAKENRIAMGGATSGEKFSKYDLALQVYFRSVKTDAEEAQDDQDAVIDTIYARWRADRNFGTAPAQWNGTNATVWQAGEGSAGITYEQAELVQDGQTSCIDAVIRGEVWLYIAA
jgi:hypothetical protein